MQPVGFRVNSSNARTQDNQGLLKRTGAKLRMNLVCIFILLFLELSRGIHVPLDAAIVQLQSWGLIGTQQLKGHVLLNGAPLTGANQEVDAIIKNMSVQENLPSVIGVNMTSVLTTCTVLRSRECILEGSELHWTDRVFCDGKVYLTLDHNDTWKPHVSQAMALKELWDQEFERTRDERIRLQEGCFKLMRELGLSVETSVPVRLLPKYMIPLLCILVFIGLIVISLLFAKRLGLRHPGGVVGSVIHYPQDMNEMVTEEKGRIYRTLRSKDPAVQALL